MPGREVSECIALAGIREYPVHLLGNLINLQMLSVRHNLITDLPGKCFPRFQTSLRELLLDDNKLTVLPFQASRGGPREALPCHGYGFRLVCARDSFDARQSRQRAVGGLWQYHVIVLRAAQMHMLDTLESFSMKGNDIKNPPLNYDKEGFPTLRKYWKAIEASEKTGALELVDMSLLMFPPELALDRRYANNIRYLDLSKVPGPGSDQGPACACLPASQMGTESAPEFSARQGAGPEALSERGRTPRFPAASAPSLRCL